MRFFSTRILLLVAIALVLTVSPTMDAFAVSNDSNNQEAPRIYGKNRFETTVEISKNGWPNGSDTVIIAAGHSFPDALAGGPLAYQEDSPILLTSTNKLPDATIDEIRRLGAKKAIILGGSVAVSENIDKELKAIGLTTERVYGKNRFETAVKIADSLNNPIDKAIVVNGFDFPDALAIAPYASKNGIPILLTQQNKLPAQTLSALKNVKQTIVIGGEVAISKEVFSQLPNPTRVSGKNRFETAVKIIETFKLDTSTTYITSGLDFADALTGSVLAAKNDSPILLVSVNKVHESVAPLLKNIKHAIILGGPNAVGQEVADQFQPKTPSREMLAHYMDVGQGDATLLQGPDFTVLIDAGRHDRSDVVPYLQSVGVTDIDLLILTHPHSDHIGQAVDILNTFNVTEVWMDGNIHTSNSFERLIDAIEASGASYYEPRAGEEYEIGSLEVFVLHPDDLTGNLNNDSISLNAKFGNIKFLFTGDAEKASEDKMLSKNYDLKADIYQVGHHGSNTSSTSAFLNVVKPKVAIYSAGKDNMYGHPHQEVINRLLNMNVRVYGTDIHGTIIVKTDGNTFDIQTQKGNGSITEPIPDPKEPVVPEPGCVNINTASFEELQQIIHIGPERAQQIIDLRPFKSIDDLSRINGIGPSRLKDIKDQGLACIGG